MTLDHVQIRAYFAPPAKSYWRWLENGGVAGWKDELTIAFREELTAVLDRLAPRGLPPLGSILLVLAACRDNWEEPPDRRTLLHTHLGLLYGGGYSDLLAEVLTGLGKIYRIREQVRGGANKAALAAALFEDASGRVPPGKSAALAERFRLGLADEEQEWKPESGLDDFLHDLGCLRSCLTRFNFDRLDLRLQTGLDELPAKAPLEPPPPSSARELIATLQDDPELGAVARLAQLLLAAVQLPRALADPDELPIGGVSDIANRGSLDRLLLSELASDDLTLAVRVAMNEALYMRRESPPRTPPRKRRVLLDAGLRTWGVPRVFVTAVALAIAAKTDDKVQVETFRAAGNSTIPVDLTSVAGLKAHLAALDHWLHPAAAVKALGQRGDDDDGESDVLLVTTDDTLADGEFQRQLREADAGSMYLAVVNRDGRFELHHKSLRGSKLICRARFDLDEVLKPRPKQKGLLDSSRDLDLPAFFQQPEPPLRFSCPVDVARSWFIHPQLVLSYTRDGRLLLWSGIKDRGARQLASGLTAQGNLLWCSSLLDDGRELRLVVGKRSKRGLFAVTLDIRSGKARVLPLQLTGDQPQDVIGQLGAVLVIHRDFVEALSWESGELLASRTNLVLPQRQGRFFVVDTRLTDPAGPPTREWQAITYQPGHGDLSIRAERVFREPANAAAKVLGITEVVTLSGPVGITAQGSVFDLAGEGLKFTLQPHRAAGVRLPLTLAGISRDGQRFLVRGFREAPGRGYQVAHLLIDVAGNTVSDVAGDNAAALESPLFKWTQPRVIHARFRGLGVSSDGALTLVSRRGQHWPILHRVGQRELRFPSQPLLAPRVAALRHYQEFQAVEAFDGGYDLSVAEWPGGSKAWLDGRGLLHLRSADRDLPEMALVLCDGPMGGWLADGQTFGANYWLGQVAGTLRVPSIGSEVAAGANDGTRSVPITLTADEVYQQVLRPFLRQLT